jgi:hypothetical protein
LQLGATIDYSILMTNNYLAERETKPRKEAAIAAISKSALSVLTSGLILTVVGYLLYFTSTLQSISQIGRLVGRGALLSMGLVLSLLPALLSAFDKIILNAQHKANARQEKIAAFFAKRKPLAAGQVTPIAEAKIPQEDAALFADAPKRENADPPIEEAAKSENPDPSREAVEAAKATAGNPPEEEEDAAEGENRNE